MSHSDTITRKIKKGSGPAKKIVTALFSGLIAFVIFLAISSFILTKISIESRYLYIFVLVSSGISTVLSAVVACIVHTSKLLLRGMTIAIILSVTEFLILLCFNNISLSNYIYLLFPVSVLSGFIACVFCINIKKK